MKDFIKGDIIGHKNQVPVVKLVLCLQHNAFNFMLEITIEKHAAFTLPLERHIRGFNSEFQDIFHAIYQNQLTPNAAIAPPTNAPIVTQTGAPGPQASPATAPPAAPPKTPAPKIAPSFLAAAILSSAVKIV